MNKEKVFGLSIVMGPEFTLYKVKGAKIKKYQVEYKDRILAKFDTEEKGRMYMDALEQGTQIGREVYVK